MLKKILSIDFNIDDELMVNISHINHLLLKISSLIKTDKQRQCYQSFAGLPNQLRQCQTFEDLLDYYIQWKQIVGNLNMCHLNQTLDETFQNLNDELDYLFCLKISKQDQCVMFDCDVDNTTLVKKFIDVLNKNPLFFLPLRITLRLLPDLICTKNKRAKKYLSNFIINSLFYFKCQYNIQDLLSDFKKTSDHLSQIVDDRSEILSDVKTQLDNVILCLNFLNFNDVAKPLRGSVLSFSLVYLLIDAFSDDLLGISNIKLEKVNILDFHQFMENIFMCSLKKLFGCSINKVVNHFLDLLDQLRKSQDVSNQTWCETLRDVELMILKYHYIIEYYEPIVNNETTDISLFFQLFKTIVLSEKLTQRISEMERLDYTHVQALFDKKRNSIFNDSYFIPKLKSSEFLRVLHFLNDSDDLSQMIREMRSVQFVQLSNEVDRLVLGHVDNKSKAKLTKPKIAKKKHTHESLMLQLDKLYNQMQKFSESFVMTYFSSSLQSELMQCVIQQLNVHRLDLIQKEAALSVLQQPANLDVSRSVDVETHEKSIEFKESSICPNTILVLSSFLTSFQKRLYDAGYESLYLSIIHTLRKEDLKINQKYSQFINTLIIELLNAHSNFIFHFSLDKNISLETQHLIHTLKIFSSMLENTFEFNFKPWEFQKNMQDFYFISNGYMSLSGYYLEQKMNYLYGVLHHKQYELWFGDSNFETQVITDWASKGLYHCLNTCKALMT